MQKKKKIFIALIAIVIVLIIVLLAVVFLRRDKENAVTSKNARENIYMAGNLQSNRSRDISIWKDDKIVNLGYSLNGYVHYFSKIDSYLIQKPKENGFELCLIEANGNLKDLGDYKANSINVQTLEYYIMIPINPNQMEIINIVNYEKYLANIPSLKNNIISINNNYVFYQNGSQQFCYYDLINKKITTISNEKSNYISMYQNDDESIFIDSNGSIYYYDYKNNSITKDQYTAFPNMLSSLDGHNGLGVQNISVDSKGAMVYEYNLSKNNSVIIIKNKNEEPELIETGVSSFKKIENYYFYNTESLDQNIYITKVFDDGENKIPKVISAENLDIDSIKKVSRDLFYALTDNGSNDLFEINLSGKNTIIASGVSAYVYQNKSLVYVKTISRNTDNNLSRANVYDIYFNNKKVESGAIYCSVANGNILYKTESGEFYSIENGEIQKIDISIENYAYITNGGNNINSIVPVENCKFNLPSIEGYWRESTKYGIYYCKFNKYGEEVIPSANTQGYVSFNSLGVSDTTYNSMVWTNNSNEKLTMLNQNKFVNQNGDVWIRVSKKEFDENASIYIDKNGAGKIADFYFAKSNNTLENKVVINDINYYIYKNNSTRKFVLISQYGEFYSYDNYLKNRVLQKEVGWEYTINNLRKYYTF